MRPASEPAWKFFHTGLLSGEAEPTSTTTTTTQQVSQEHTKIMNTILDPSTIPSEATSNETPESPNETAKVESSEPPKVRRPRGFAAMDRSKVSEIASKGGKAAHAAGTAHQFSSDEARNAGRKGGVAPHVRRGRGPRNANVTSPPTGGAKEGASE